MRTSTLEATKATKATSKAACPRLKPSIACLSWCVVLFACDAPRSARSLACQVKMLKLDGDPSIKAVIADELRQGGISLDEPEQSAASASASPAKAQANGKSVESKPAESKANGASPARSSPPNAGAVTVGSPAPAAASASAPSAAGSSGAKKNVSVGD